MDNLGQQPGSSLAVPSKVATGVQLAPERRLLKSQRKACETQVGETKVAKLEVQSVNPDNSDSSIGKAPTVQIDVCWDVTHVDVVNAKGKSIASPSRPNVGWTQLTVANYHHAGDPTATTSTPTYGGRHSPVAASPTCGRTAATPCGTS